MYEPVYIQWWKSLDLWLKEYYMDIFFSHWKANPMNGMIKHIHTFLFG